MDIHSLLAEAVDRGASDLHISANAPPTVRVDGRLEPLEYPPLRREDCIKLVYGILNDAQKEKFERLWELDLSLEITDVGRFRVNVHRQRGSTEAAFRVVNEQIRSLQQLGLPKVVEELARRDNGLILVTGPTGSGKTTTLAAMIDQINNERTCMIITIEDPIEYIHRHKKSIVKQREVTSDTRSFADALRHVLRQDPDVICVGEMRDLETITTALMAAETGHLVLTTLHTPDAVQTVDRIIDVFPPHQQQQTRIQLANTLQGIVAQHLLPIPGGRGRVVATEILIATIAVRKIIRSAKTEQLTTLLQTSFELGMITMDKSLKNLYQQGLVSYDDAISKCKFPDNFDNI
jgi:twitching motility protein PilT